MSTWLGALAAFLVVMVVGGCADSNEGTFTKDATTDVRHRKDTAFVAREGADDGVAFKVWRAEAQDDSGSACLKADLNPPPFPSYQAASSTSDEDVWTCTPLPSFTDDSASPLYVHTGFEADDGVYNFALGLVPSNVEAAKATFSDNTSQALTTGHEVFVIIYKKPQRLEYIEISQRGGVSTVRCDIVRTEDGFLEALCGPYTSSRR